MDVDSGHRKRFGNRAEESTKMLLFNDETIYSLSALI